MAEEYVSPGRSSPRSAQYAQIHWIRPTSDSNDTSMDSKQSPSILKGHQQKVFYLMIGNADILLRRTPESDQVVEEPKDEVPTSDDPVPEVIEMPVGEAIANEEPAPEEAKDEATIEESATSDEIPSSEEPIEEEIVGTAVVEDSDPVTEPEGWYSLILFPHSNT